MTVKRISDINKAIRDYASIEDRLANLESMRSDLRSLLVAEFKRLGIERIEDTAYGTFSIGTRITYSYSGKVDKLAEKVKVQKALEESEGTAKVKSKTEYLLRRTRDSKND